MFGPNVAVAAKLGSEVAERKERDCRATLDAGEIARSSAAKVRCV